MNDRIALILKTKNISPSQLADDLGVQRSGISHIINGRNKPSLEFIQKLIRLYPDISMQWILFGEGPMMNPFPDKPTESKSPLPVPGVPNERPKPRVMDLFADDDQEAVEKLTVDEEKIPEIPSSGSDIQQNDTAIEPTPTQEQKNLIEDKPVSAVKSDQDPETEKQKKSGMDLAPPVKMNGLLPENKKPDQQKDAVRQIKKIVVFYNDRTFVEYNPGDE